MGQEIKQMYCLKCGKETKHRRARTDTGELAKKIQFFTITKAMAGWLLKGLTWGILDFDFKWTCMECGSQEE